MVEGLWGRCTLRGSQPAPRSVPGSGSHANARGLHRREHYGV